MKLNYFFVCLVLIIIIIPHSVDAFPLFATQKEPVFHKSGFGICERNIKSIGLGFNKISSFYNAGVVNKGNTKLTGKFSKFLTFHQPSREIISNVSSEDCANNAKSTGNEYEFVGTKLQFWLYLLFGGFSGILIGCIIVFLFFYYTTM